MSREALLEARELIKAKRYDEARFILKSIDHPTAREWLAKLDQIAPPPKVNDNPFDSPFDDPFATSAASQDDPFAVKPTPRPRSAPPPPPPQPEPPLTQRFWINDESFGKPAKPKSREPQISNGVMILTIGGMLVAAAFILAIVYIVFGDPDADNKEAAEPTSIFNFGSDDFLSLETVNRGELHYGDIIDDYVADNTKHVWTFQGTQGERVDIAIQSDWDTVLELRNANGTLIAMNDDEPGQMAGDARLYDVRLPSTGTFQIVVKPFLSSYGTYRLWLNRLQ
ncbi:MAG: hypothetical protein BroJett018_49600 [Chloroflexota bacterium]|nr:MAG: hypothetical protein BroJett018_49600 [Chloroflexota bacterium]